MGPAGEHVCLAAAFPRLRREGLLVVAAALAMAAIAEAGGGLWGGVLYLRTQLESGIFVGAGSAVFGYLTATAARVIVGPAAGRGGAISGVALGPGSAVVGIALLGLAPTAWVDGVGLVIAAAGLCAGRS